MRDRKVRGIVPAVDGKRDDVINIGFLDGKIDRLLADEAVPDLRAEERLFQRGVRIRGEIVQILRWQSALLTESMTAPRGTSEVISPTPSRQSRECTSDELAADLHSTLPLHRVRVARPRHGHGEWHTYEEAEETYLLYIRAAPEAVGRLELWHDAERIHVDPAKISAVTAA